MPCARGRIVLPLVVVFAAAGCAPDPASSQGAEVHGLYTFFLVFAAVIFVVTAGLIAWSLFRYRDKGARSLPPQVHSHAGLEILWFVIPQLIVVVLFVASAQALWRTDPEPGTEEMTITVTAFQWGWRFDYDDHGVSVSGTTDDPPTVVVPTGVPIAFELEASDVVHSFYVPELFTKRDAIPGRTTRIDITVEEEGQYRGFCTEFCGVFHEGMTFGFEAISQEDFDEWVADRGDRHGDG